MSSSASNLRVFVHFKEPTVFAGEDVQCTITFKNIDRTPPNPRPASTPRQVQQTPTISQKATISQTQSLTSPTREVPPSKPSQAPRSGASQNRGDGPPLNVVDSVARHNPHGQANGGINIADSAPARRNHSRTLSIISLGSDVGSDKSRSTRIAARPGQHSRAASVTQIQTSTLQRTASGRSPSLSTGAHGTASQSPLSGGTPALSPNSTFPTPISRKHSRHLSEAGPGSRPAIQGHTPSNRAPSSFKFPTNLQEQDARPSARDSSPIVERSRSSSVSTRRPSPRIPDDQREKSEYVAPLSRVFSLSSQNGTPRSSMDLYTASNNSNETLFSEYSTQPSSRLIQNPFSRVPNQHVSKQKVRKVENLMMGYVQISGSFTLDSSLVNPGPFEEVKRKAVVGGKGGGGVVGIERPQSDGGFLGAFTWGSIGESLGGFLGGSELSSIKEMKNTASSKSIPLLSTPKSILFVDLKLNPGESKSYSYSFTLPRGLPPSHKGRAMKVNYHLVIGTQRPSSGKIQQQMKQVEVPFRVFGGVNSRGEDIGHDLMSPYVILKDQARTTTLSRNPSPNVSTMSFQQPPDDEAAKSSHPEFQAYVERLLNKSRQSSAHGLVSPTADLEPETPRFSRTHSASAPPPPPTTRALIDATLRRSSFFHANQDPNEADSHNPAQSSTRFTIARSSVPVATIVLSRSALRLGDMLTVLLDFSASPLACYAFEATLESSETIDSSLAIRSKHSVERVTRRVWGRTVQSALWARRCTCSFQVPANATPGFNTSGVGLDWCVRVELVVQRDDASEFPDDDDEEEEDDDDEDADSATDDGANSHSGRAPLRTSSSSSQRHRDRERERARQRLSQSHARRHSRANTSTTPTSAQSTAPQQQLGPLAAAKTAHLLREAHTDDRGVVLGAVDGLLCESFEVAMPLRVFGAAVDVEDGATTAAGLEGYAV